MNIASLRALREIRQDELAEYMRDLRHRWTRATVSEVERGDRNVTVDELASLAIALDVPLSELLDPDRQGVALDVGLKAVMPSAIASAWLRGLRRYGREGDKYVREDTLDHLDPETRLLEWFKMLAASEERS